MKVSRHSWHYRYHNWIDQNLLGFNTIELTESTIGYIFGTTIVVMGSWLFLPLIGISRCIDRLGREKLELVD